MSRVLYVHVGTSPPPFHLVDTAFQSLRLGYDVVVVLPREHVEGMDAWLRPVDAPQRWTLVACEDLVLPPSAERYTRAVARFGVGEFRSGFWIMTTLRFFYVEAYMRTHAVPVVHVENDVMLYIPPAALAPYVASGRVACVQDAPHRVVPSVVLFPSHAEASALCDHLVTSMETSASFLNDMDLLACFPLRTPLPLFPTDAWVFDGAAIGQYLGGIDPRNASPPPRTPYTNTTRGFVNETSVFKPDTRVWTRTPDGYATGETKVANLHIHSKQLYQFSPRFDLLFEDIVTGDRVVAMCDLVIAAPETIRFHRGLASLAKRLWVLGSPRPRWADIGKDVIKVFIYTHSITDVLGANVLDPSYSYVVYTHNSDHAFTPEYAALVEAPYVRAVYAQNLNYPSRPPHVHPLPIGCANAMWPHGDVDTLYMTMRATYMRKKTKAVYVNLNPATYAYRAAVLASLTLPRSAPCSYAQYLSELADHRFCLCVRGNGIDTHRFWESLYLGVVPIVINTPTTACAPFLDALRGKVPFHEVTTDDVSGLTEAMFDDALYQQYTAGIQTTWLKLGAYDYK